MSTPAPRPTLAEVKASIGRELGMRRAVYAKPTCRLSEADKAKEIAAMEEAYRIIDVVGQLRKRIQSSTVVNELARMVKEAGMPTDPFVSRHQLGAAHHPPQIAELITADIMAAIK